MTRPRWIFLGIALLAALLATAATALQGLLLGPVLRLVLASTDGRRPSFGLFSATSALTSGSWGDNRRALLGTLALAALFRAAATAVETTTWTFLAEDVALRLRLRVLHALLHASHGALDALPPGVAATRLTLDPRDAAAGVIALTAGACRDGVPVVLLAVMACLLRPALFAVTLAVWPLVALALLASGRRQREGARSSLRHRDTLAAWAAILPAGLGTLVLCGGRAWGERAAARAAVDHCRREFRRGALAAITSPSTELAGALAVVAVLAFLRPLGPAEADRTVAFFYVVFMAYRPLKSLGNVQILWASGALALEKLRALEAELPGDLRGLPARRLAAADLAVLRGSRKLALSDALAVGPGELVVLTGPSGRGKTTLLEALALLRPASEGTLRLDGEAATGVELRAGFAPQHPPIFPASVRENLLLGADAPPSLEATLAALGLEPWIAGLAQGLDTLLGPGGVEPSGGERLRLGLARALLAGTPLVLVDEPTAGLDPSAADRVRSALRAATQTGRGVLAVSHDPLLAASADRVIAL